MKYILFRLMVCSLSLAPLWVLADGSEVVIVYNKRVPESMDVADYYARMRQVPENQIFGFEMTTNEVMSRKEFRDSLQLPLAKDLEKKGLWKFGDTIIPATNGEPERVMRHVVASKIRYAVLCYGVPLKIASDPDLDETIPENLPPQLQRNDASVDSELAWLPMVKVKVPLTGPLLNWTYGVTNTSRLNPTNGILLVTRLDGPTADIARGLVDKALQAERDGLWGRAYFDARGIAKTDKAYYLGDEYILGAAEVAKKLGFETVVDDKPDVFPADFPVSQIAIYAGWYAEDACGPFALPTVEFMPGAFAYHLHSFSAATLRSTTANWCGPFLAKGATCTMGCVNEPYLTFTPNVAMFLERFAVNQFTLGEAAWASQPALSWQTTVIGDPLYRPFNKPLAALYGQLAARHSLLIEWPFLRLVNMNLARGEPISKVAAFLENLSATTNSAVLTEKLADIYEAEGKPSLAADTYQRALNLNPSPEQRISLRLMLGRELLRQNLDAAAMQDYQKLLEESPDYPGKNIIEDKIKELVLTPAITNTIPGKL